MLLVSAIACLLSIDKSNNTAQSTGDADQLLSCTSWRYGQRMADGVLCEEPARNIIDIILMMIVRCTAILYIYYHFCHLQQLGSKYILDCIHNTVIDLLQLVVSL
uniref:Uncharacterized protein n=1 Tax=Anopheles culicifacies TaxID=139723 RepID=A0A182M1I2_9DIPT